MESKGRLYGITKNYMNNKFLVTFEIDSDAIEELNALTGKELTISAKQFKEKRSLDANAYFHVLVDKLANVQRISKIRCKNIMIARYGQPEIIDDQIVFIKSNVPIEVMMESEILHCHPARVAIENDKEVYFYKVYRGSHTYDTKEMSILINGLVDECQDAGIETMTPQEIERMVAAWQSR